MNGQEDFDGLDFHDYQIRNQDIKAVIAIE